VQRRTLGAQRLPLLPNSALLLTCYLLTYPCCSPAPYCSKVPPASTAAAAHLPLHPSQAAANKGLNRCVPHAAWRWHQPCTLVVHQAAMHRRSAAAHHRPALPALPQPANLRPNAQPRQRRSRIVSKGGRLMGARAAYTCWLRLPPSSMQPIRLCR
jgi:hypothetical protein